ncbi:MAG: DUF3048 domain-containing protein [Candidatus Magasanikbacteria bacterium]|nr:DUF3048 domain-containing protein [Candidatus Magasanikbacteria bacterium]
MKNRDLILMIAAIILFAAVICFVVYIIFFNDRGDSGNFSGQATSTAKESPYKSRLTGLSVEKEEYVSPKIIGIMIDNNPEAYPQSGLNEAAVVYEAPVEGGISRFLAIYPEYANVEKVGPVRSARPYYIDWIQEYGTALYMHCGGSQEGLTEIKVRGIFDANEFFRGSYYWRENLRSAPYNLYTSSEKWQKYFIDYGEAQEYPDWQMWNFGEISTATDTENISSFDIEYIKRFAVGWQYISASGTYQRKLNGETFLDDKNVPISASNIIVQFASVRVIDEIGRRKITSVGEGEARLFRDGLMFRGVWKKETESGRTRFYTREGKEMVLTPGRTWIMVVPEKSVLNVSN